MKLLIPTDFSKCADYALEMAILIANKSEDEIHLLHSLDAIDNVDKFNLGERKSEELRTHIRRWSQEKLELLQRDVLNHDIVCRSFLCEGKLLENMNNQLKIDSYDLVVMGSHGASGKEEWFIGSNTSKAVRKLHSNILVVKSPIGQMDLSKAVFVTGLRVEEQDSFKLFLDFIKLWGVKEVHLLSIDTYGQFSQPTVVMKKAQEEFKVLANEMDLVCHLYRDYSIQDGIRNFTKEHDVNLIGISNTVKSPIKRIFSGSNVEMLVNHSDLPVLSIDY